MSEEETKEEETKAEKKKKKTQVNEVILRSYPKIVFFYPLLLTSLILWPLEWILEGSATLPVLGYIWMIVLFANLFVIAFDFSSTKFFILILAIVVIVLLLIFLVPWGSVGNVSLPVINFGMTEWFYMTFSIMLGIILLFVFIATRFDYWKIERNEVYHKKGLLGDAKRYPVRSLRFSKDIPDIFEYFALRAGSITLHPTDKKIVHLTTVPNINKKEDQLDYLLSHLHVEIDELDR